MFVFLSLSDLVPHGLVLPPASDSQAANNIVKEKGMLPTEKDKGAKEIYMYSPFEVFESDAKDFTEIFKEFCLSSLFITPEAISALQAIRIECNKIAEYEFFKLLTPLAPLR